MLKIKNKAYWEQWAKDIAQIVQRYMDRILTLVHNNSSHHDEFNFFLEGLRKNLNPSVSKEEAIRMLVQHMITKPVFSALFGNYSFVNTNHISKTMQGMIDLLEAQNLETDTLVLTRFYHFIEKQVAGINNAEGRQRIIIELYDNFFKYAFPDVVEKLGIVYTPVEIVDFIINSVAKILIKEFGCNISDDNVHILDPFTGTGTFITRLIQSGLLGDSLHRKYLTEIHANEIVLLAYYIASINIENAYHDQMTNNTDYQSFNGIYLTDTFQLYEYEHKIQYEKYLQQNTEQVNIQKNYPITVIIGNPPYSRGQGNANNNAKNQIYPKLHNDIAMTYAKKSAVNNKNSLYDSYIKAFYWSSKYLEKSNGGIIAFISNSGWLDGNAMDGMRKCLFEEFSKIYVFNLRGNCRTSGELRRKEAGNIFGLGSRAPIAITILIKKPKHQGQCEIYHYDIGDYLNREQKLAIIAAKHDIYNQNIKWEQIIPNESGDWINQRSTNFINFIPIGDKDDKYNIKTFFKPYYSLGIGTNRDTWCYNSSNTVLQNNINRSINFFNEQQKLFKLNLLNDNNLSVEEFINYDANKISWSESLINLLKSNKSLNFNSQSIVISQYRPFFKQYLYIDPLFNQRTFQMPKLFPTQKHKNLVICVSGVGSTKDFSSIITNIIPDLELTSKSQCFPRYYYEINIKKDNTLFTPPNILDGYVRHDAITDYILKECQTKYSPRITKDDIFYYVYGLLHSEDYRKTFSADLKKMLPRLPLVDTSDDFLIFSKAGRYLAEIHINYEAIKPYSNVIITGEDKGNFTVDKLRFINKNDKSTIQYNPNIKISDIPLEAYDYIINGRSAIEWIIDRYQVNIDKDSGIKNDPNDWVIEHNQPRYILDLLLRIITVSLETMKIVKNLPKITF
jgi:predicted helicase